MEILIVGRERVVSHFGLRGVDGQSAKSTPSSTFVHKLYKYVAFLVQFLCTGKGAWS
jgi:hypothetical protein